MEPFKTLIPGQRVRWSYSVSGIPELSGVVVRHRKWFLWELQADRGTRHIVSESLIQTVDPI